MNQDRPNSTNTGSGIVQDANRLNPRGEANTQSQAPSDIVADATEATSDIIRGVRNVSGEIIEHAKTAADGLLDHVNEVGATN